MIEYDVRGELMKVFDFDNTIYDGESSVDAFLFVLKKRPSLIKYLPSVILNVLKYKLRILKPDELYLFASNISEILLEYLSNHETLVNKFWETHKNKLKSNITSLISSEDVIISSSPRVLLDKALDYLNTKNLICTENDMKTGKVSFLCFKDSKVSAFKEQFPDAMIDELYTDSFNDAPLMKLSKKSYLVKGKKEPVLIAESKYK